MLRIGYTVPEIKKALGISDSAVYRMVEDGVLRKLPHTGSRVIVGRVSLIEAFGDDAAAAIDGDVVVPETDTDEIASAA